MNPPHTNLATDTTAAGHSTTANAPATPWTPPALLGDVLESAPLQTTLTAAEQEELTRLEVVVKGEWASFVKVGAALKDIRDGRLYRDQFATFEDYCRGRWGFGRSRINRQIGAAHVGAILEPIGATIESESVARPMVGLADDQILAAYQAALKLAGNQPVTAKLVRQAAAKFKPTKVVKAEAKAAAAGTSIDFEPAFELLKEARAATMRRGKINRTLVWKKLDALQKCLVQLAATSAAPYRREGAAQ